MDSFYASIEISDKPFLKNKPVAVGGKPKERGVLTTCNYIARKYGVRSAMSSKHAVSLCKNLIILPVDIEKYKTISKEIFKDDERLLKKSRDERFKMRDMRCDIWHATCEIRQCNKVAAYKARLGDVSG